MKDQNIEITRVGNGVIIRPFAGPSMAVENARTHVFDSEADFLDFMATWYAETEK